MNNILFLVCIGFMMNIFLSNASLDSPDEELLETLRDTIMDLTNQIDTLSSNITTLENQLSNASIIPPYSAVNYAICSGRASGLSGDAATSTDNSEFRCPSGSVEVVGENGERGSSATFGGDLLFNLLSFTQIEECEEICVAEDLCVAYNWFIHSTLSEQFGCNIYKIAEPDIAGTAPIIFCALDTEEPCEIGKIIAWSGSIESLPPRYLLADGSTLTASDYPDLCAIIDGVCGTGCVVPDLSGRFIVGTEVMSDLCEVGGDTTLSLADMTGER